MTLRVQWVGREVDQGLILGADRPSISCLPAFATNIPRIKTADYQVLTRLWQQWLKIFHHSSLVIDTNQTRYPQQTSKAVVARVPKVKL
jgi:hypothetical protein